MLMQCPIGPKQTAGGFGSSWDRILTENGAVILFSAKGVTKTLMDGKIHSVAV